jgi:hypothetical protein
MAMRIEGCEKPLGEIAGAPEPSHRDESIPRIDAALERSPRRMRSIRSAAPRHDPAILRNSL